MKKDPPEQTSISLSPPSPDAGLFYSCLVGLSFICAVFPWLLDFLPMQDYPQHLFIAHVVNHIHDTAFNYSQYYTTDLRIGPYVLFFVFLKYFNFLGIEAAGKLFISIYVLLLAVVVYSYSRREDNKATASWVALLILPLGFHQIYFLGFTNYLISLPLLLLALLDLEHFAKSPLTVKSSLRQAGLVLLIYFTHPYTILAYIGLAMSRALFALKKIKTAGRFLLPATIMLIIFCFWYFQNKDFSSMNTVSKTLLLHWPNARTARFLLLPFLGMQGLENIDPVTAGLWILVMILLLICGIKRVRKDTFAWQTALYGAIVLAAYFILPFSVGKFSYFNARLAPLVYFFILLWLSRLTVNRKAGIALAVLALALCLSSFKLQRRVAQETADITPLLDQMQPNGLLLPIIFDAGSALLAPEFFYEFHTHDYFYYHVRVGGGATPSLFDNPMLPVRLRRNVSLPRPAPDGFSWRQEGRMYNYIVSRGAPEAFDRYMRKYTAIGAKSDNWALYVRR